jgi:hypothetical protein
MKNNGTISVQEKRELSKILDNEFSRIITDVKQEIKYTQGEILEQAKKKFGLQAINLQIKQLNEKIEFLKKKKREMGFDYNDDFETEYDYKMGSMVKRNTKAGRYFYLKVSKHADIQELEKAKSERLKHLWLSNSRSEVKSLVEKDIQVKLIRKGA